MRIVVAPDGFGGTLSARAAAAAIAAGWRDARPGDEVTLVPLSDGGEGLLDVVARDDDERVLVEVAGPQGRPVLAHWLVRADGTAVVESAQACGLALVPEAERTPMTATSYGVGELLEAVRARGVRRVLVGLGGSATVEGGAGALSGLGFRVRMADGSGLKVGGESLRLVASVDRGWSADWSGIDVELLADVTSPLSDAAHRFGPQKGASPQEVELLTAALATWADVAERDLQAGRRRRDEPGMGAAGGLGFGLACGLGARLSSGAAVVAELAGLADALAGADVVVTGEGRLDATSAAGKVVGSVLEMARVRGVRAGAVVGQVGDGAPTVDACEAASPDGPGADPAGAVREAAARLAARW